MRIRSLQDKDNGKTAETKIRPAAFEMKFRDSGGKRTGQKPCRGVLTKIAFFCTFVRVPDLLLENEDTMNRNEILLEISEGNHKFDYTCNIQSALSQAESEIRQIDETIESVKSLKPECDATDYALAACSGALCGIIDVFLVGKPGGSPFGDITDRWFENRTRDFARICGWKGNGKNPTRSAIGFLERYFNVPYDQRGCGDAGRIVFGLTPSNHHFKSLAHNPSLLGLFFSILDQFTNSSHFVSEGQLIELVDADGKFELRGHSVVGKLWCGFVNWFGHLVSDVSGSSGSKGRGTGIPSPLWTWANGLIAVKAKLNLPVNEFDRDVNELALKLFKKGYDIRFQTSQAIPVLINECMVRLCYAIRRLVKYYDETEKENRSFKNMWHACEPFANPTVKRMLTVAHGTFCLVDIADASIRGFATGAGTFNPVEFFLRLNLVGVGRFAISLYGETKRGIVYLHAKREARFAEREKTILKNYLDGLNVLKERYDDEEYLSFVDDLNNNEYLAAFAKTTSLAVLRGADESKILRTKQDIDAYFIN